MFQCNCREVNQVNCSHFYLYFSKHIFNLFFHLFFTCNSRSFTGKRTSGKRRNAQVWHPFFIFIFIFIGSIKFGLFHSGLYLFNRTKPSFSLTLILASRPGKKLVNSRCEVILKCENIAKNMESFLDLKPSFKTFYKNRQGKC